MHLGAATITDLTWKQTLDLYACTECGRCQSACPAWNTGKPLSPKLLVMNLRDHLFEEGPPILEAKAAGTELEPVLSCPASSTRRSCGAARRAAPACRSARSTSSTSTRSSTCAATW